MIRIINEDIEVNYDDIGEYPAKGLDYNELYDFFTDNFMFAVQTLDFEDDDYIPYSTNIPCGFEEADNFVMDFDPDIRFDINKIFVVVVFDKDLNKIGDYQIKSYDEFRDLLETLAFSYSRY